LTVLERKKKQIFQRFLIGSKSRFRIMEDNWTTVRINRDLRKACDSLLDNPRIKALGITSISGLITYCLRKELDRD